MEEDVEQVLTNIQSRITQNDFFSYFDSIFSYSQEEHNCLLFAVLYLQSC